MTDLTLTRQESHPISYTYNKGDYNLCVLYLHGWTANRKSERSQVFEDCAKKYDCAYLSLDYTGHGESGGTPADFTVGQGIQDALDVIRKTIGNMPLLIIGHSIGGWIGLQLAERLKEQVIAYIGLAPATDITEFIWDKLIPFTAKRTLKKGGVLGPSEETHGFCFTQKLFDDAKTNLMLKREIDISVPVYLLVGDKDDYIQLDRLNKIKDKLKSEQVTVTQLKGADHHLSKPEDLNMMRETLSRLLATNRSYKVSTVITKALHWFFLLCLTMSVGYIGSTFMTPESMAWYDKLILSTLTPPAAWFGIAWTLLYFMMSWSAFLVWNKCSPRPFVLQLGCNLLWPFLFFHLKSPVMALIDLIIMLVFIGATICHFGRVSKIAGWMMVPVLLWSCFAFYLNMIAVLYNTQIGIWLGLI